MRYVRLGSSGLQISPIALGCMGFGEPARGSQPWSLEEDASRHIIKAAIEAGVNFFDTANVYSGGSSEQFVGRALRDFARRDDVVIASKVHGPMRNAPNGSGLSRKAIMAEIDHSLRRLGVDYVDLYQIHRWDPLVPIEETMEALSDVVKSGKARYIGASSMRAWQFAKAQFVATAHGWQRFVSMQNHYNLLYREEEREMLPLCADLGVGAIPWSPLARGRLTRTWDTETRRSSHLARHDDPDFLATDRGIVDSVATIAEQRQVSRAGIALAWLLRNPVVSAPIVGVTKLSHLQDAVAAIDLKLTDAEAAALTAGYRARPVSGIDV